jgi:hypothetical protein
MKYFWLSITLVLTTALSAYSQTATFSGRVTDQNTGVAIPNVAVVASGNQTGTRVSITDPQGNYLISMGANNNIKLRAYRTNFIFNPLQVIFISIGGPVVGAQPFDFSGTALPFPIFIIAQEPILLTEDNSLKALSVDSVTFQRDPFPLLNNNSLGSDKRTRIKLLLVDLELFSGETLSIITAQAIDHSQTSHNLPVEDLRKVPGQPWLSQLTVMLPSDLGVPDELTVSVTARGKTSNAATIRVQ